jgi:hypothetical protein
MASVGGGTRVNPGVAKLGQARVAASGGYSKAPREPKKPKFNAYKVLKGLSTGSLLTPEQLSAAARALAVLETRPEIHGYKQIATQLGNEKGREAKGLTALGQRTSGNVASTYQNIATSAAQSLAREQALGSSLSAQSANIAKEGTQNLAQVQSGALGDYEKQLQMRGSDNASGGTQQALAQAVAAQQQRQQADSQASQQLADSQAQGNAGLLAAMAGSAQMRGGESVGAINRATTNRIGESNAKYDTNIQTALGKLAEAKASFGGKFTKNLLGLREGDQKFKLGEQAVQGEKAKAAAEAGERGEAAKQQAFENALSVKKLGLEEWEAHHPNAGSNERQEKAKELKQERGEVRNLIGPTVSELGRPPQSQKELNILIGKVNSKASAEPRIVAKVLKHWFQKHQRTHSPQGHVHR